jgi:hypothetical protein
MHGEQRLCQQPLTMRRGEPCQARRAAMYIDEMGGDLPFDCKKKRMMKHFLARVMLSIQRFIVAVIAKIIHSSSHALPFRHLPKKVSC